MPIIFPPHELADEDGLLAVGGNLESETLISAYCQGIFPWPIDGHLAWFSPPKRAIIKFNNLIISKTLIKVFNRSNLEFKFNSSFEEVIKLCAHLRKKKGTWITKELEISYIELNKLGFCHSLEAYNQGVLVGGIYGVCIGKMFSAESMFYIESNASKLCLLVLIAYLKENGFEFIDCQQFSSLVAGYGAEEINRKDFLQLVSEKIREEPKLSSTESGYLKQISKKLILSTKN